MATDYTVGDSSGWTQGVDYKTWASDKTFKVGDTLEEEIFDMISRFRVHLRLPAQRERGIEIGLRRLLLIQLHPELHDGTQHQMVLPRQPGGRYFICGTPGHCSGGMKLAVSVASSGSDGNGNGKHLPSTLALGLRSPTTPSGLPAKNTPDGASTAGGGGVNGLVAAMAGALFAGLALLG
ncbi:uncharacterized protein A4U43_C04F31860 [Asparagus officinalis]|uniref:Phytocyanin domain-containing protein n=1 Tax=Asparagus officinalis TaxID=4686 RepID=A0A5P1F7U3_ASPOF|nr:uncharacterized protein A4U43_C04F31860 [Asparagus officinalis]